MQLVPIVIWSLAGSIATLWATRQEGEAETVTERITTNLGAVLIAVAGAVATAWVWKKVR